MFPQHFYSQRSPTHEFIISITIAQIILSIKSAIAQSGQYTLTESTINSVPLHNFLGLLEIQQIQLNRVFSESENSLDVIGTSSLLGADSVEVELSLSQ